MKITAREFAQKCIALAESKTTIYVLGGWGEPMTELNKKYFQKNYAANRINPSIVKGIENASSDMHGFDCNCYIKSLLDGYSGTSEHKGGATYGKPCPDITIEAMLKDCTDVSSDMNNIEIGEYLCYGDFSHAGVYVGNGVVAECTYRWANGVQLTTMKQESRIGKWKFHGKMTKYLDYTSENTYDLKSYANKRITLSKGDQGNYVKSLQEALIKQGYSCGSCGVDGDFGKDTRSAVQKFQNDNAITVTGIADYDTIIMLIAKETS